MNYPLLTAVRWQMEEFIFVEYLMDDGVFIDVGPFPRNPDENQTDEAYAYLEKAKFDFLILGELEWTLDLDKLATRFSQLEGLNLHGLVTHEPAFEATSFPTAPRFFAGRALESATGCYFLRIDFEFKNSKERLETQESAPPGWEPPRIISD